jgi:hypothetical protein
MCVKYRFALVHDVYRGLVLLKAKYMVLEHLVKVLHVLSSLELDLILSVNLHNFKWRLIRFRSLWTGARSTCRRWQHLFNCLIVATDIIRH